MYLYVDEIYKSGDGSVEQGEQVGGRYIRRIVTGTTKAGRPQYRYLRTKEEVEAYEQSQKKKKKEKEKKDPSLEEKLSSEQKKTKEKLQRDPSLFLKDKTEKSFPLYLED